MVGAETVGIAAVAMLLGQGLIELLKFLIGKFTEKDQKVPVSSEEIKKLMEDALRAAALNEPHAGQLRTLYEMHMKFDNDGTPIWYVPRSWNETMREIVDKLYKQTEVAMRQTELQNKTLSLVERLERRLENQTKE